MNPADERRLYDALRGPIIYDEPTTNKIMEDCAVEDLRVITPIIDEMLEQAENRGKLSVYLEVAASQKEASLNLKGETK